MLVSFQWVRMLKPTTYKIWIEGKKQKQKNSNLLKWLIIYLCEFSVVKMKLFDSPCNRHDLVSSIRWLRLYIYIYTHTHTHTSKQRYPVHNQTKKILETPVCEIERIENVSLFFGRKFHIFIQMQSICLFHKYFF